MKNVEVVKSSLRACCPSGVPLATNPNRCTKGASSSAPLPANLEYGSDSSLIEKLCRFERKRASLSPQSTPIKSKTHSDLRRFSLN